MCHWSCGLGNQVSLPARVIAALGAGVPSSTPLPFIRARRPAMKLKTMAIHLLLALKDGEITDTIMYALVRERGNK